LVPQEETTVTLWVQLPQTATLALSNTIIVKALGRYGVQTEVELTATLPAFQENNGQVVLEAEHFAAVLERDNHTWLTQTVLNGYIGSGYVTAWPDTDQQFTTTYTMTSSKLSYSINFTTTGVYTVWLRAYAPNAAGDSVYVGLGEQPGTLLTGFAPRIWSWANDSGQGSPVTINVIQPGLHQLHIWQREDGLRLDRILLTTNNDYNPVGSGPPESKIR
jgi:hypothetical protein